MRLIAFLLLLSCGSVDETDTLQSCQSWCVYLYKEAIAYCPGDACGDPEAALCRAGATSDLGGCVYTECGMTPSRYYCLADRWGRISECLESDGSDCCAAAEAC